MTNWHRENLQLDREKKQGKHRDFLIFTAQSVIHSSSIESITSRLIH